jgi:uncharacterized protein (DUF58 family)
MISDPIFLRRLEQLRKVARRVGRGGRGEHQSRHRGPGLELADHRAYAAGDDPRRLDWNAFARLERPLVRLFHADESLRTYLLVDTSGSMLLGSPPKLEQAVRVAAALAYLGVAALDPVTILTFGAQLTDTVEAVGGKRQLPALFEQLGNLDAGGETDLDASVTAFLSRQRPRGLVVVLSDFLGGSPVERALLRLRHARHLTTVVQITAAEDRHGPAGLGQRGQVEPEDEEIVAEDVETGAARVVSLTAAIRARYEHQVLARMEALGRFCRGRGITYLGATAEQPFDAIVLRLLRAGGLGA